MRRTSAPSRRWDQRLRLATWFRLMIVTIVGAAALGLGAASASAALVTVTLDGSAKGSVTSDPAGIECSNVPGAEKTDCSFDFPISLTGVQFTAVAADGAVLKGWTGTAGGTCSGTTNPCQSAAVLFNPLDVTATFSPTPDTPSVATGGVSEVVFPSAALSGTVNPNSPDFGISDCFFEYGITTAYGTKTPCRPGTIGPGTAAVSVAGGAGSLEPGVVYHYRVVASNLGGANVGDDRTFTAAAAPADPCPNAAIRAQQHVLARTLPNCRAYELVSPPNSLGQAVIGGTIAPDGNGISLASAGALEDAGNAPGLGARFYAHRTEVGWRTVPLIPSATTFPTWRTDVRLDNSTDGRTALFQVNRKGDANSRRFTPVRSDHLGNVEIAGPTIDDLSAGVESTVVAASADLRTLVIRSVRRNVTTDGAPDTRTGSRDGLYVSRPSPDEPGAFRVRQVAFRNGATMNATTCGVALGSDRTARGAVSDDGRRIFFSFAGLASCRTAAQQRVWVRDGDAEAEDLATGSCTTSCGAIAPAYFEGASYDGQRIYLTTEQKLLNGDQDDSDRSDLYVYDYAYAGTNRLRAVTSSGTLGQGAGVLGVVRVSDDGSYVYFVANGRPLAGANARSDSPQSGDNNLYVYHRPRSPQSAPGEIRFVGRLDAADVNRATQYSLLSAQNRPVVTSTDGRYVLFAAYTDLTGEKLAGDVHRDLFRYDAATDELIRIWSDDPQHNGAARSDGVSPNFGAMETPSEGARQRAKRQSWVISDDGKTVAFSTAERLSPNDVNTQDDAYMWEKQTGTITMLSDGRSVRPFGPSGVSPGGDVFFGSDAELVPEHRSGAEAVFVARRGGGFAPSPEPSEPCLGDACQGADVPAPGPFADAGSSTFVGGGNVDLPVGEGVPEQRAARMRVAKVKSVRGTRTRVRVRVPSKGKIRISGSGLVRASKSAKKAGTYRVTVWLSKRARHTLRRKDRMKVRVRVRFTPAQGRRSVVRRSVTFKAGKKRSSKASSRSVRRASVLSSDVQKGR